MYKKLIGVVHNLPVRSGDAFSEASLDIYTQVENIEKALKQLGYPSVRIPFTRGVIDFIQRIREEKVEMVFNLCETLDEDPRFAGHPAAVLELLGIPFSGSPSMAIMLTTDKLVTKRLLKAMRIMTPNYLVYDNMSPFYPAVLRFPVIVKPRFEDASIGIDQESIFEDEIGLGKELEGFFNRFGTLLVEEYVAGREFNISIFGYPSPRVLPIAEMDFSGFPKELYHIAGYRAKWEKASFEYRNTSPSFPQELPHDLLKELEITGMVCFCLLMLRDYGRVDVRVDDLRQIHVLEVNANPCLSPDAGFAAAVQQAGMSYTEMVSQLVDFIERRSRNNVRQASHTS
ncbi:MAG: hypothetical protein JSU78_05745 [Deltaproteobacteria bacterium]|nr:MAG: hypothetical protein JSU78_05745 [Deltaproteobacteria bacterium]